MECKMKRTSRRRQRSNLTTGQAQRLRLAGQHSPEPIRLYARTGQANMKIDQGSITSSHPWLCGIRPAWYPTGILIRFEGEPFQNCLSTGLIAAPHQQIGVSIAAWLRPAVQPSGDAPALEENAWHIRTLEFAGHLERDRVYPQAPQRCEVGLAELVRLGLD
jgi:hypothetical protein